MLRSFLLTALCLSSLLITSRRVDAGVMHKDVQAYYGAIGSTDFVYATAAHGFFSGNDAAGDGDPLFTLLTAGTSTGETAKIDGKSIHISSTGMFSTNTNEFESSVVAVPTVDVIDINPLSSFTGYTLGEDEYWKYLGKSGDDDSSVAFESVDDGQTGIITLNSPPAPLDGPFVLSLKAGNQYSVYLFEDAVGIKRFEFSLPYGLSHAALFQVSSNGGNNGAVPEPGSIAVFGFGALLGLCGLRRSRNAVKNR